MTCPLCGRETAPAFRPFCSKRCADLDLGNWLNGSYSLPSTDQEDTDADPSDPAMDTPRTH